MKCKFCEREIPEDAKYCPYCANAITEEDKVTGAVAEKKEPYNFQNEWLKTMELRQEKQAATNALVLGIIAFVAGVFGGFFVIASVILGVLSIIFGAKAFRGRFSKKGLWAMIFGGVGLFLTIVNGMVLVFDFVYTNKADDRYREELNIPIPDRYPTFHDVNSELLPSIYPDYYLQFDYFLFTEDVNEIETSITYDNRWIAIDSNQFLNEEFEGIIIPENGYYLIYDRITKKYMFPANLETYNIVFVLYDSDLNMLTIYEFQKAKE